MDEGSNSSQDLGENSEDEQIISHKPKKSVQRIFDDESEDSRDMTAAQDPPRIQSKDLKTAEEALDEILNAGSSSDDSDGEHVTLAASLKKKKIVKRRVADDSSDDDQETLSSVIKNNAKSTMSDVFDAEEDCDSQGNTGNSSLKDSQTPSSSQIQNGEVSDTPETNSSRDKSKKKKKKKKKESSPQKKKETGFGTGQDFKSKEFVSDSSDSEDDKLTVKPTLPDAFDDDEKGSSSDSDASSRSRQSDGDEGFDESTISPALLKKLKKGAAKKERPERKSKTKAMEEKMKIHSETQRMIRESRVSLPYHQPAPRSINDFLARATKKQHEYKVLRGTRDFTKAKLMQDLLQKTKLPAPTLSEPANDSDEDWTPEDDGMKKLKDRLDEKLKGQKNTSENKDVNKENTGASAMEGFSKENLEADLEKIDGDKDLSGGRNRTENDAGSDNESLPDIGDTDELNDNKRLAPFQGNTEHIGNNAQIENDLKKETAMDIDETENDAQNKEMKEKNEFTPTNENSSCSQRNIPCSEELLKESSKDIIDGTGESVENTEKSEVSHSNTTDHLTENNTNTGDDIIVTENNENKDPNTSLSQISAHNEKSPKEKETQNIKVASEKKRKKLAVLASLDLDNVKPSLSGNSDTFICLEEEEKIPAHPGVVKLMDRLCKHTAKREKKHATDVDISIIEKEKAGIDKEELKLNTFTYHTEEETENPLMKLETPGAKLTALKEQLQAKMKEKREQARQHRQEVYDLDNEEGGFNAEEEEAEMSEHSDTDVEEDEDIEDDEEENEEMAEEVEEEQREVNPFADEEAAEDDDGEDDKDGLSEEDEMNLKLDTSDEESEMEGREDSEKPAKKKKQRSFVESDNETGDTEYISSQAGDRTSSEFKEPAERLLEKPFSMFGSKSTSKESMPDTQLQSGQRNFSLSFPEESQDLYGNSSMPELGPTQYPQTQASQKLNFYLEESQSNMLDADGYLRVKSTVKKPTKLSSLDELSESQDQMDDLLGLCSGRFTDVSQPKDKTSRKSLFDESDTSNTQNNMDELMGLCSGVFSKVSQEGSQKKGVKRKVPEEEENNDDSLEAFSDNEQQDDGKDGFIDDDHNDNADQAEDNDTDEVDGDDDEEKQATFTGFTVQNKHGKIRPEFVEAEAELSGSEVDSDEDLDLLEEDDIMEIEEGDKDKIADSEQLRDEVGRVHLKQLIDEDKRELMRFQEMYLPDGDLHSEGAGRMRRFRWNNNGDDTQQDMFDNDSEGEQVEDENDNDFMWRKERFEREQFIQEQQEKEPEDKENSQFMKFGKIFLKKQSSVDKTVVQEKPTANKTMAPPPGKESLSAGFYKLSNQKRGSFLARSKEALAKIAEMTKPVANPSAGAKSSGKFTFAVISPDKENSQKSEKADKPKRQARTDTNKNKVGTKPPAKKQKLDSEESFTENSIFHHL